MRYGLMAAGVGLAISVAAAEKVQSGPQVGERPPALEMVDVTGPNKGKQLCYP
ncbi:MAG: hypothetical protein ACO1SX_11290 [Actinomycetota bacterium]